MTFARMIATAALGAALLACPALADPTETMKAAGKDASWLAIQTASRMQFDGKTLTLRNVTPSVVMFTDRPARLAETLPLATFLASWQKDGPDSFRSDPPNTGFTTLVDGQLRTATVELSDPRLDGTTLTFKVRIIEGTVPAEGETTALFIDSCFTCIG